MKKVNDMIQNERIMKMEETNENKAIGNRIVRWDKTIRMKYINDKVKAVKHACNALMHLNKRKKFLGNNYTTIHKVS